MVVSFCVVFAAVIGKWRTSLHSNSIDWIFHFDCATLWHLWFLIIMQLQGKHTLVLTKFPEKINLPENAKQEQTECISFEISNKIRLKMIFKWMCDRDRKWNA